MWNLDNRLEYRDTVSDLLSSDAVQSLRNISQHSASINCYDHSLFVSYVSYRVCKKFGWDAESAARGGLLHDLFMYDQHDKNSHEGVHLFSHPKKALLNACRRFRLNKKEKDIILKHMWPLTPTRVPKYKESFVVCFVDTVCAIAEMLHVYHLMHTTENLQICCELQKSY